MNKLLLTTFLIVPSLALSHTNSIGYVGDGNGGLNFWYGSWHDGTQFNEAEIKIIRPDGTTSIDAFNLLEQDSPAGLISGVNYFTSDGTQLQPYDPNTPHPMGMPNESYTWQGLNYTNLAPGQYTFVYIPLGDVESNLPGSPTAEWMPMDEVIRSLTIQLTQGDLDGDANQNGILDVLEVTSGQASGGPVAPTVVSQGQSMIIANVVVTNDTIQIVQRTRTDTTWDVMSDGTIQNTQSRSTELPELSGRVDQVKSASGKLEELRFRTGFVGLENDTNHFGVIKESQNGLELGFGISTTDTASKKGISIGKNGLTFHAAMLDASYSYDRSIGDFSNSGYTTESGREIGIHYEPNKNGLSPIVGVTMAESTISGWTEKGSAETALTFGSVDNSYRSGVIGMEYNTDRYSVGAKYYSTNTLNVVLSADKIEFGATRDMDTNQNTFSFGLVTKF